MKIVDLAAVIETGIDCEFWDDDGDKPYISPLIAIHSDMTARYATQTGDHTFCCQPRYGHWHNLYNAVETCNQKEFYSLLSKAGFEIETNFDYFKIIGKREGWRYAWEEWEESLTPPSHDDLRIELDTKYGMSDGPGVLTVKLFQGTKLLSEDSVATDF